MTDKTENRFREITIPGDVLDDESLSDGAKIMYGKIARLSFKNGYCSASNYFLDGTKSGRNASRYIAELKNACYIVIENDNNKFRKIWLKSIESRIYSSNPDINNIINLASSGDVESNPASPVLAELSNLASSGDVETSPTSPVLAELNVLPRQIRRSEHDDIAISGEQTVVVDINTTTTSETLNEELPTVNKVVAVPFSENILKNTLIDLDSSLIGLFQNFYTKAIAFLTDKNLDLCYAVWIYEQCKNKNYKSLKDYYYSIFFLDNLVEEYKLYSKTNALKNDEQITEKQPIHCPVCNTVHAYNYDPCPNCFLPYNPTPDQINYYKQLNGFIPEKRENYYNRISLIQSECGFDATKSALLISKLNQEFGIVL